jgi:uncharacterized protein YndB with AHSA1/START domain
MITINMSSLILRPVSDVFVFVSTPENNSQWQYGSMESSQISEGSVAVGTKFSSFGHFMGRRIQTTFEVTELEANKTYGFKTISGPIQLQTSYKFESVSHGTNLTILTRVSPGGFFKLVDPIVGMVAKKQFEENVSKLKELLEAREFIRQE